MKRLVAPLVVFLSAAQAAYCAYDYITVDVSSQICVSRFSPGATNDQALWENGDSTAVSAAKNLLSAACSFQNQLLMGWGTGCVEPSAGTYDWSGLDARIGLIRSMNSEPVLTFCTAPGWMKGSTDGDLAARVDDAHVADFAMLCASAAIRYPDIVYFQVWRNLAGYWNAGSWDYTRYTQLYNAVYDAVKAVRPDAKLGGPYLKISGDAGETLGKTGAGTPTPIVQADLDLLNYWNANRHGADFICVSYSLVDPQDANQYTCTDKFSLTYNFGDITGKLKQLSGLPVWFSEFDAGMSTDTFFTAAAHASAYCQAVTCGADCALLWAPQQGEKGNYLFTDTAKSTGAVPSPLADVVTNLRSSFGPGTTIYQAITHNNNIDVLAGLSTVMLVNKTGIDRLVRINNTDVAIYPYFVAFMPTPALSTGTPLQYINIISPNGGETWLAGSQQLVQWQTVGEQMGYLDISLSTDGRQTWTKVLLGTADDGSERITVPDVVSDNCYIMVEDPSGLVSGQSVHPFTITDSGNFTVKVYPNPYRLAGSSWLSFVDLPADSSLRIYTQSGKLVRDIQYLGSTAVWYGNNSKDKYVAAGVYFWVVRDKHGNMKSGKIRLLR